MSKLSKKELLELERVAYKRGDFCEPDDAIIFLCGIALNRWGYQYGKKAQEAAEVLLKEMHRSGNLEKRFYEVPEQAGVMWPDSAAERAPIAGHPPL